MTDLAALDRKTRRRGDHDVIRHGRLGLGPDDDQFARVHGLGDRDDRGPGPLFGPGRAEQQAGTSYDPPTPEQVLAERFARGDIDADDYRQRMEVLRTSGRVT
ncbi:hypothetical protein ACFV1N_45180 [Streptosporangium canum]|uniref:hypothetical protein n=1 Tax=Streptosporangium canum TaxID=324952 RepID=UPI0036BC1BD3